MRVMFLGVGAALDQDHTNTSMILKADNMNLLLDCGYSVPPALWKYNQDPDFIDAIWISHQHADHLMGMAPLLCRMREEGREKTLHILTRPGLKEQIEEVIELGYPGTLEKAPFDVKFVVFYNDTEFRDLKISTADTVHPVPNKAIRIEHGESSFCYSGDGEFTESTRKLYEGADLLVHESFLLEGEREGHASMDDLAEAKKELNIGKAAAVHIMREVRSEKEIVAEFAENNDILLPVEGDVLEV